MHDRRSSRSTSHRTAQFKKGGAGSYNWGTVQDQVELMHVPINEAFIDPNWSDISEVNNSKIRVSSISSDSSTSEEF